VLKTDKQFKKIVSSIYKILSKRELLIRNNQEDKYALDLLMAKKEILIQNEEKERWADELLNVNKELNFQNQEKEKQLAELIQANLHNVEIEKSRQDIEEKNRNITDSIIYAKRIQQAQLPKKEEILASLSMSFILFKPKDIVSGDFYFFKEKGDTVFIAAADSTGHGVPGALMSMIGAEKLSDAVSLSSDPSEILARLNRGIRTSLRQSDSQHSSKDGMDIALCVIDLKKQIIKFSGANRPIWIIRKDAKEVEEIKGTKKAIGGYTDDDQYFSSNEIKMEQGDTFYIFSDGYADTFGGEFGKKLMTRKFKEILIEIQSQSMDQQEIFLEDFIEGWKAGEEQVDDILVIGVRL